MITGKLRKEKKIDFETFTTRQETSALMNGLHTPSVSQFCVNGDKMTLKVEGKLTALTCEHDSQQRFIKGNAKNTQHVHVNEH